jgi:hypothetical protein
MLGCERAAPVALTRVRMLSLGNLLDVDQASAKDFPRCAIS